MNFFYAFDSRISSVITGISNAFHPSLSYQTGYQYNKIPNDPITNDEFLQLQKKDQSGLILLGVVAFLILIMKKK